MYLVGSDIMIMCIMTAWPPCLCCVGDSRRGWAESLACPQGGCGHHQRESLSAAAALPPDTQHHLCGEELHHHIPPALRLVERSGQVSLRLVISSDFAVSWHRSELDPSSKFGHDECQWYALHTHTHTHVYACILTYLYRLHSCWHLRILTVLLHL